MKKIEQKMDEEMQMNRNKSLENKIQIIKRREKEKEDMTKIDRDNKK